MPNFRLTVFKEFAHHDVLAKVPENITVEVAPEDFKIAEDKRSDKAKEILATNAKLFHEVDDDEATVKAAVAALVALGFTETAWHPSTSTGMPCTTFTSTPPCLAVCFLLPFFQHTFQHTGAPMNDRVLLAFK